MWDVVERNIRRLTRVLCEELFVMRVRSEVRRPERAFRVSSGDAGTEDAGQHQAFPRPAIVDTSCPSAA